MKIERGHWIIAGVTGVIIAYLFLYAPVSAWMGERAQARAQAAQAAAEAQEAASDEGVADVTTAGSISTGTILKREGVAVAELWGMKKIGAKAADVVKFTSHDSADRFREFLQGLRERETFQLLGHELPSQTALWIDDFNDPTHRLYTVETPDGETYQFCGWVKRVKTHPPLEGALVFEADVQCTHGPLTREVTSVDYYHCTSAPSAPGTPPPDDPDHWEVVLPGDWPVGGQALEDGEAVFGYDSHDGSFGSNVGTFRGTVLPFPTGSPTSSVEDGDSTGYGSWPDPANLSAQSPPRLYSIYCVYDPSDNSLISMHAYLENPSDPGNGASASFKMALYATGGELLATTDEHTLAEGDVGWYEFTPNVAVALVDGTSYVPVVWTDNVAFGYCYATTTMGDYEPPNGNPWDDEEDYEYCQTVAVVTTTEETYCP